MRIIISRLQMIMQQLQLMFLRAVILYRGYYTVAQRYEFYFRVAKQYFMNEHSQPAKTSVSPRSSPLGTFRKDERLRLSGRNSILMTQSNVYIINPVVMGFQLQICPILGVVWSILVSCCVHLPTSSSKTQMLLTEKTIFHKY